MNDKYFKSEKHKIGFMLLKHEKALFDDELGIKNKHYTSNDLANIWKNKYQLMFNPDNNIGDNSIDFEEIMIKINKIYLQMVGKS
jgi:hypothetical protein